MISSCGVSIPEEVDDKKENLAMHFTFDSTTNNQVLDSITNKEYPLEYVFKNAAYKNNEEVPCVEGVNGNAISFDGNSVSFMGDKIDFGNSDFSLSFYVAPRAYERNDGQYTTIFSNFQGGKGIEVSLAQYGVWKVTIGTTKGSLSAIMNEEAIIPLYDWSYIAIRYHKAQALLQIFLNDQLVNSLRFKNYEFIPSESEFIVGKNFVCMDFEGHQLNHFNGLLDDLKVYKEYISDKQIASYAKIAKEKKRSAGIVFSYETLSDDRYAPQYHMRNPLGWSNEFYGAFYYHGKYHVFNQHNPFRAFYQNGQRWGHLVSDDLVHWEAVTPALTPSSNHIDDSQTFSGSCILDKKGNPIMFYTGVNEGNEYFNSISYARPKDLNDPYLTDWEKSNVKIIHQGSISNRYEFRDPFVYQEDGDYFMLIGGNNAPINSSDGAVFIYKATNDELTSWEYLGVCYSGSTSQYKDQLGSTYELPNLFKIYNQDKTISKYMLMVSPIYGSRNSVTYWIGNFNKNTGVFTPDDPTPQRYDLGATSMALAASGFYDTKNQRTLMTSMIRTPMSSSDAYLSDWNGAQTLWKEIYLNEQGQVSFQVIKDYETLYQQDLLNLENASMNISSVNTMLDTIHSDAYMLDVEFELNGDTKVGAYVKYGASTGEQILLSYDMETQIFNCDTSKSSLLLKNHMSGGGIQPIEGNIRFKIFIDRSFVECYLNDKNEISTMVFNKYEASNSIKLYAKNGKAKIKQIKVISLSSAYGFNKPAYWE